MTGIHIGPTSSVVLTKRSRSDARAIDLHAFSLTAQAAQNEIQLKSMLLRTLRAAGVEFLQLTTYRRLQFASVIWSELPEMAETDGPMCRLSDSIACRAMTSGAPERWTLDDAEAHVHGEVARRNALSGHGIKTGVTAAIHGANDWRYVFHFGACDVGYFDIGRAGLSVFSTLGFIASQQLLRWKQLATSAASIDAILSVRELEVIRWCKDGKTYPEISQILGISVKTVEFHITNAMRKLGVNQKISAIVEAARQGLIEL